MRRNPSNLSDSSTTYRRWMILGIHLIFVLYTLGGSCYFFTHVSNRLSGFGIEKGESIPKSSHVLTKRLEPEIEFHVSFFILLSPPLHLLSPPCSSPLLVRIIESIHCSLWCPEVQGWFTLLLTLWVPSEQLVVLPTHSGSHHPS